MANRRSRTRFQLGGEQAEADPLAYDGFYSSADYISVESRTDPHCFVIGRTGSGKSALLQRLEADHVGHVVRIDPEDLSLPYITDLGIMRSLVSYDVHLDPFFIALWKHVLLVELIKHRYNVDSPGAKRNFVKTLRDRIARDKSKQAALDYFDEFSERFWCETDERVREITNKFESEVQKAVGAGAQIPRVAEIKADASDTTTISTEVRSEQASRFQRVVNETQLARLNQMLKVLDEDILDDPKNFTYVVIDDLDRDWVDERLFNDLIRCLFRAVIDLQRVANLKIVVALRTNIFEQLNFGSRSGGQEEKFRALSLHLRWGLKDLRLLLDERTRAAAHLHDRPEIQSVFSLLPKKSPRREDPLQYMLDRTLMRPRDCIAFFNEALSIDPEKDEMSWADIRAAEQGYSHKRLLALRDEWKPTYPGIDQVFACFRKATVPMDDLMVRQRLDDVALLVARGDFEGTRWVSELATPIWDAPSGDDDWTERYSPLVRLLYRIGFLGIRRSGDSKDLYSYQEPDLAERPSSLAGATFTIHRAFRNALDVAETGQASVRLSTS